MYFVHCARGTFIYRQECSFIILEYCCHVDSKRNFNIQQCSRNINLICIQEVCSPVGNEPETDKFSNLQARIWLFLISDFLTRFLTFSDYSDANTDTQTMEPFLTFSDVGTCILIRIHILTYSNRFLMVFLAHITTQAVRFFHDRPI